MRLTSLLTATCLGLTLLASPARAENAVPTKAEVETLIEQAQTWLVSKQEADGAFAKDQFGVGVTGLAATALSRQPKSLAGDPAIAKALAYLKSNQQADGGVYTKEAGLGNYNTSLMLMALSAAGKLDSEKEVVAKAQKYLFDLQRHDGSIKDGGIGYDFEDGKDHQDMPNTTMAVKALRDSGVPASDPHLQAAIKFLEHCQNLSSVNNAPWVDNGAGQGSCVYTPDESQANGSFEEPANKSDPVKKLIGTGSMTYSLISTYIILDLKADDARVAAALGWCKKNYGFDANPGMTAGHEHEGLLYYYFMMGRTMRLLGLKQLELADGKKVDWRADLFTAIKAHAKIVPVGDKQGALFMNDAKRWGEAFPHLATAYLIETLKDIDSTL
jgi:squalene-hopene/tetraprenyl-beta-curcumene cyclase